MMGISALLNRAWRVGVPLFLAIGCSGTIAGQGGGNAGDGAAVGGMGENPATGGTAGTQAKTGAPGLLALRPLTRVEYNNTVLDLLGDTASAGDAFPSESAASTGFAQVQKVDEVNVALYYDAAEAIAGRAVTRMPSLFGCDPLGSAELDCIASFVSTFGRRAYRRPVTSDEIAEYVAFYKNELRGTLKLNAAEAARALVTTFLQSPFFLYRWENAWDVGKDGSGLRLGAFHLASQLSYFLWASMPDEELMKAAENDALKTEVQIEAQVRRMLAHAKAERSMASFAEQWMGVSALSGALRSQSGWDPTLARAMVVEIQRFVADTLLKGEPTLETLFSSRQSTVGGSLAALYGVGDKAAPSRSVMLPDTERSGILTLAGVMAAHSDENESSPILRGKFIREHVMCDLIPPPPGGVPDLEPPRPGLSKKERFAMHRMGTCSGCHVLMDPIGFGFEHYDNVGKFRATDNNAPVDSTGAVSNLDGNDQDFASALELTAFLAKSPQVAECLMRQFFRFGLAKNEGDRDEASLSAIFAGFRKGGFDIREMLVSLLSSEIVTHRTPNAEEVLP
jgi:Protein of unknown function (DUF1592)/Protein of unknown function (DUF1588)/Protein of unknown function (DUF1595)/Protein of unknown function (DUF1587)/Protein of unknown function (DUF1585)